MSRRNRVSRSNLPQRRLWVGVVRVLFVWSASAVDECSIGVRSLELGDGLLLGLRGLPWAGTDGNDAPESGLPKMEDSFNKRMERAHGRGAAGAWPSAAPLIRKYVRPTRGQQASRSWACPERRGATCYESRLDERQYRRAARGMAKSPVECSTAHSCG